MAVFFGTPCPICKSTAKDQWLAERRVFLVSCESCSTFTITIERRDAFAAARERNDRDIIRLLDSLASYLRAATPDQDREVTEDSWLRFVVEAWGLDEPGGSGPH
jgi:Zn ribbon nucleic-acid-binding protein